MSYPQVKVLRIARVADALRVSNQTVFRMIQEGELEAVMERNCWWIPQPALQRHVLRLIGKWGSQHVCDETEEKVNKMDKKSQHFSDLTRYYIQKELNEGAPDELEPQDALRKLEPFLRAQSRRYGRNKPWLRDDVYQEMALAILLCISKKTLSFYVYRAASRVRDFLRKERRRGNVVQTQIVVPPQPSPERPDCSQVIALFKLAGMSLSLLEEFGIHLVDEDGGQEAGDYERTAYENGGLDFTRVA